MCKIWKDDQTASSLKKILSNDEIEKANRFVFEKDKKSYIVSRATLRTLLAKYLNISPRIIEFDYNQFGKPFLTVPEEKNIKFNLSHSNEYCIIAINKGVELGIDIEWINKRLVTDDIAKDYF